MYINLDLLFHLQLHDDNFATIVEAIKEGRKIVDNINKCLVYLISANLGEIMLLSSAMIVGLPTPLLAKQILYVNLATDGSPAIALGTEPSEPDIMNKPPSDPRQSIFSEILNIGVIDKLRRLSKQKSVPTKHRRYVKPDRSWSTKHQWQHTQKPMGKHKVLIA